MALTNPKTISEKFIDQLYALDTKFVDEKQEEIKISGSGFLGLLACGYKGLACLRVLRGTTYLYSQSSKAKRKGHE